MDRHRCTIVGRSTRPISASMVHRTKKHTIVFVLMIMFHCPRGTNPSTNQSETSRKFDHCTSGTRTSSANWLASWRSYPRLPPNLQTLSTLRPRCLALHLPRDRYRHRHHHKAETTAVVQTTARRKAGMESSFFLRTHRLSGKVQ